MWHHDLCNTVVVRYPFSILPLPLLLIADKQGCAHLFIHAPQRQRFWCVDLLKQDSSPARPQGSIRVETSPKDRVQTAAPQRLLRVNTRLLGDGRQRETVGVSHVAVGREPPGLRADEALRVRDVEAARDVLPSPTTCQPPTSCIARQVQAQSLAEILPSCVISRAVLPFAYSSAPHRVQSKDLRFRARSHRRSKTSTGTSTHRTFHVHTPAPGQGARRVCQHGFAACQQG